MHNTYDYDYDDADNVYKDASTGVLKNLLEISDSEQLLYAESGFVTKRLRELHESPIKVLSSNELLAIHHYLFQDVYAWAGKVRTVELSKGATTFFQTKRFSQGFLYIDNLVSAFLTANIDIKGDSEMLANILDSVNYLHPFREGNGRAQREFIRSLALQKGYTIDLNSFSDTSIMDDYMSGTINGDVNQLTELISRLLVFTAPT
ncbi:MAG: Fic family protein [Bifidobacteriaceae bacterium]|jgi:cell filamentation protein|nr:Fic family protein [Bifidobacteriaceae bacterium]